jgi:two-component system NtrC family sensor kinase
MGDEDAADFAAERARLLRKMERERRARETAETLLETKSLELFRARETAEADRHLLTQAIGALEDGFAIVDNEGRLVLWNGGLLSLLGQPVGEDLLGRFLAAMLADLAPRAIKLEGDSSPVPLHALGTAIYQARAVEIELEDNRLFLVRAGSRTDTGRPVTIQDRTASRFVERRLRESQKHEALGTLAGGIAHEINTPTQYITDNLQFLLDGLAEVLAAFDELAVKAGDTADMVAETHDLAFLRTELPEAARQGLEGARQIQRIVSAIRLYSHPVGEEKVALDVGEVIQEAVTISRNEWKYVADLSVVIEPGLPPVVAFADGIRQLALNLVVNAAQALAERAAGSAGRIVIDVRRVDDDVVVSFDDNGPGVPDSIAEKVFDPFFTTKPPGKGTGQGLAICRRIVVEDHGGRFTLTKSDLGGARFLAVLPITDPK